jgi:hypothetical protein
LAKDLPFCHKVIGKTQEHRRIGVTKLEGIKCALFIQGGKYSTHEMKLFNERNDVAIISFVGSGGAAGGGQPYEGWTYDVKLQSDLLICSTDPKEDVEKIAEALVNQIIEKLKIIY